LIITTGLPYGSVITLLNVTKLEAKVDH